jgi:cell division protein ZipA
MIIIGMLLIVAVLLDGYRRVRNENRHRIKVSLSRQAYRRARSSPPVVGADDDDEPNPELPNGGARVITKRKVSLQLDQAVPVLLDSVAVPPQLQPDEEPVPAPCAAVDPEPAVEAPAANDANDRFDHRRDGDLAQDDAATDVRHDKPAEPPPEVTATESPAPAVEATAAYARTVDDESRAPLAAAARSVETNGDGRSSLHENRVGPRDEEPDEKIAGEASGSRRSAWHAFGFRRRDEAGESTPMRTGPSDAAPQDVLAVYVTARNGGRFKGQDLLQLLLACDLRFGKKNIFHRHEKPNGCGAVQFSVANIIEPGTFDLDRIEEFSTPGVCLFLVLPGPEAPYKAFDYMIETAQVLVRHLDGELRDDTHSALTRQTLEHCRQRIRDFERKQLTLHL